MQTVADLEKAKQYFVEQLSDGTSLARLVLERIDLSLGRFRAGMPEGVDQSEIDFHCWMSGMRGEERAFAEVIKRFIENTVGGALVEDNESVDFYPDFENEPYRDRMARYGREVYWRIDGPSLSESEIVSLLHSAILPYPLCIFIYLGKSSDNKNDLDDADLEQIVAGLVGVAVGAFDTESYLLWWRDDLVPFSSVAAS